MANVNFLIEWNAEFVPKGGLTQLSRTLDNIPAEIFKDGKFTEVLWKSVGKNIGKIVRNKFKKEGPGWKRLSLRYSEWKLKNQGKRIKVGTFGKRTIKFTQIGKLTGILEKSATIPNKDANIFEVKDIKGWKGGSFKYAINLEKLPYAGHINAERPFFFLEEAEANTIMKKARTRVWNKMTKVLRQGIIK